MKIRLVLFFLVLVYASSAKQKKEIIVEDNPPQKEELSFCKFHIYQSFGHAMRLDGDAWNTYDELGYTSRMGFFGFGGGSKKEMHSNYINLSVAYSITPHWSVSLSLLPKEKKQFDGGEGENGPDGFVLFIPVTPIYRGEVVKENVVSRAYAISANYVIVPYKQQKLLGVDLNASLGIFLNPMDVSRDLTVYDTLQEYSFTGTPIPVYYSANEQFKDRKNCYGIMLEVSGNVYIGKYFSIFGKINGGIGTRIIIPERHISINDETAHSPEHTERLKGLGGTLGVAFHFGVKEKEKIN